ncbi:LysR family transcriptional regulator [Shinella sp. BYT-45]|uniref:LysR family transcriptional regulator n=1 Tax=Shinella sp. BYT-45 TaxID=3377377 RepID=UPI00397F6564
MIYAGAGQAITNINLKLIQAFLLVAESNSFKEAADATGRSQSAVSAQIRQLESQIGVQLFHRTTRRVAVTAEGRQLLGHVKRSMAELQSGLKQIRDSVEMRRRRIRFSCSPIIAAHYVPTILATFAQQFPNVEVYVDEVGSAGILEGVRNGTSAFAVGETKGDPGLDCDVFLEDSAYAVIPCHLYSTQGTTITLADVSRLPLVMLNSSTPMRTLVEDAMKKNDMTLGCRYEFTQTETLIRMAEAGIGAAIVPCYTLPIVLKPSVQALRIVEPNIIRRIGIVTPRGEKLSKTAAHLANVVKRVIVAESIRTKAPSSNERPEHDLLTS